MGTVAVEVSTLTRRERETLELLAEGFLYKEIAGKLGISMETVREYVRNIYTKLHVNSRTEAVVKFLHHQGCHVLAAQMPSPNTPSKFSQTPPSNSSNRNNP